MLEKQIEYVKERIDFTPEIAVVLGSGLGGLAEKIDAKAVIPYRDIKGMPVSTAPSHKGNFIFGTLGGKKIAAMEGRVHLYEGYSPKEVVSPIRLLRKLGCDKLILTNASGGINKYFNVGDFMLIEDHISAFVPSPLIGKNEEELGTRFPDMSEVYDKDYRKLAKECAKELNIELKSGVYAQLTGPQFETPAEINMLSKIGADAVGMSTVIEAIAAKHCGFKICGISLISNLASGLLDKPLSGDDVTEAAEKKKDEFEKLICEIIRKM